MVGDSHSATAASGNKREVITSPTVNVNLRAVRRKHTDPSQSRLANVINKMTKRSTHTNPGIRQII